MHLLKSARALFEQFKSFTLLLCPHLKQIAPPALTAIIKASPPLEPAGKMPNVNQKKSRKRLEPDREGCEDIHMEKGTISQHFPQKARHILHF